MKYNLGRNKLCIWPFCSQFQGKQQLEHFINLGRFISWSFMLHFVIYFEGVNSNISKVFPLFWEKALVKTTSNYKDYWVHAVFLVISWLKKLTFMSNYLRGLTDANVNEVRYARVSSICQCRWPSTINATSYVCDSKVLWSFQTYRV